MAQALPEKLEHTGPTKKSGLSATKRAVGNYARAALAKRKKNIAVCLDHQIVRWKRAKVSKSRTLATKREIGAGA